MSNYAIGDLQGCRRNYRFCWKKYLLIHKLPSMVCGDLVNRGPDSLKCLLFLSSIQENCKIVLEQDLHLLAVHEGVREMTPSDTFMDVLESRNQKLSYLGSNHKFSCK